MKKIKTSVILAIAGSILVFALLFLKADIVLAFLIAIYLILIGIAVDL